MRRSVMAKLLPLALHTVVEGPNDIEATLAPALMAAHDEAVKVGLPTYIDPDSGFSVFTRPHHIARKKCCGSRCRHCPYGHIAVTERLRNAKAVSKAVPTYEGKTIAKEEGRGPSHRAGVYTRTGDGGKSSLFTGVRHSKADAVFEALGTVDELSSFIGVAKEAIGGDGDSDDTTRFLETVQQRLLDVGSIVATPGAEAQYDTDEWTVELERRIDTMDAELPPIDCFILPGGGVAAAHVHVCRSVTRRAERSLVRLKDSPTYCRPQSFDSALRYVNRLSDYFFVLARSLVKRPDALRE